jgi:hypothetical protein
VECFNVFNSGTELFRVVNAGSTAFNQLDEIMAPRIFRIGAPGSRFRQPTCGRSRLWS